MIVGVNRKAKKSGIDGGRDFCHWGEDRGQTLSPALGAMAMVLLLLFMSLTGCGGGGGSDAPAATPDVTPPTVESHYPAQVSGGITSADIQANGIYVVFDEAVKESTINNNFTVVDATRGGAPVDGAVSYAATTRTVRFVPNNALTALFNYSVTVSTGIEDLAGNHLATPYTWQFTVAGPTAPPPPPTVIGR